jgi:hypothetical protein
LALREVAEDIDSSVIEGLLGEDDGEETKKGSDS